jgi:ABC-type transport system involved in multi-copper enzyme maturation permease subunit
MSISLPTYTRREMPLLGRGHRVRAIITTGLRREFKRVAALVVIGLGVGFTLITSVVIVLFGSIFIPNQARDLSFFYIPASNGAILFFVTLMASVVGSALIADDLNSMALTLYLSRPITHADYLIAKAAILAPLISMIAVLPLVLTPFIAALLSLFSWTIALEAMGLGVLIGLLFTGFYTSATLLLSSLTRRKSYAAAGVFAVTFGLTIPATILADQLGNPSILYVSPWANYLAVAEAAFGSTSGPALDWRWSLLILLIATVLASLVTYIRMKAVEVVSG